MFIPASLVAAAVGYTLRKAYGNSASAIEIGFPIIMIAIIISASISFVLGRYVFRERCQENVRQHKWVKAINMAITDEGAVLLIMMRMSFIVPFAALNFICGVT